MDLSHCYLVTDAGVQWITGSCHSRQITHLNLSGTETTGQCFIRSMPRLTELILDGCGSLSGQGMMNIARSCTRLKKLSLAKNKQLTDDDLADFFKAGLKDLEDLNVSYTNIKGFCFNFLAKLQRLNISSCIKFKDEGLKVLLERLGDELQHLDVSASGITDFRTEKNLCRLKTLRVEFCTKMKRDSKVIETLCQQADNFEALHLYGSFIDASKCALFMHLLQTLSLHILVQFPNSLFFNNGISKSLRSIT